MQFDAAPDELAVFLAEAEEQLQLLDQDCVVLEKEGANPDLLQEVFRAAHTLKGSSAAIGHYRMANLTHAMESVLDSLRHDKLRPTTALVDMLLKSLDALRMLNQEVVTREHSGLDPSPLIEALTGFLPKEARPEENDNRPVEDDRSRQNDCGSPLGDQSQGSAYKVTVQVDPGSAFPAVRFLQAHLALAEIGTIVQSAPSRLEIEAEKVGGELMAICLTLEGGDRIRDILMAIPEICAVRISDLNGEVDDIVEHDAFAPLASGHDRQAAVDPAAGAVSGTSALPARSRLEARNIHTSKTVRIDVERLDTLMNLVGELVIDCTRLAQLSSRLQTIHEGEEVAQGLVETSLHIQRITDELQDRVMKARMFPVSSVFNRLPRMVRDLARRAGKQIEFVLEGEETELDRSVIEEISDPLIHLLRNAVDHGIESPAERLSSGKPAIGVIRLTACHRESRIMLTVQDDGRGIDPDRIRRIAVERGLLPAEAASRLGDREALELIFVPGFSTANSVSDVSGRGVGMDIVRTNIHKLNGQVSIDSSVGRGSRFNLELPLTLAIMDALLVNLDGRVFAIPLASVTETLRVRPSDVSSVNGQQVIQLRGRVLRLLPLRRALGLHLDGDDLPATYVVVVSAGSDQIGIMVDALVGEQQVVIKSLGSYIGDVAGISGATILGDGQVALILDVPALVRQTIQEKAGEVVYV